MNFKKIFYFELILLELSLENYNSGDNWAVLACGSTGYINYRHQADIFHVYHTLINRGFSKNHIILFAYDDIAYNEKNPFPGEVYNRPDGPNVYSGVTIDYSFNMVTPENYISVLKGDSQNGKLKKVLNSTKDDNIFLYFSDHGINGAMVFPDNKFLYADELEETFIYMHNKNMYNNIIYYMESCYSGSIFEGINPDLNIYSITAASPKEQSMATYCFPDDNVKGVEMHTCLSNEFTSNWLDDTDSRIYLNNNINDKNDMDMDENYSSREQFAFIKNMTKNSHVQEYGNLNVGELPITMFQSSNDYLKYNDGKEKIKRDYIEEFDYDKIMKKLIEYNNDEKNEDNYENMDYNSFVKDENNNSNDIKKVKIFQNKKRNYNYINFILDRNKLRKENKKDKIKIKKVEKHGLSPITEKVKKKLIETIPSKYVKLYYLQIEKDESFEKNKEFEKEIEETEKSKILFYLLKMKLNISEIKEETSKKMDYKCLRFSIELFKEMCSLNERDLEFLSLFSDLCIRSNVNLDYIKNTIIDVCKNKIKERNC